MRPRRGAAWLDAGVVLVAMAVVLSLLDDTFADRTYLVAGLVPVVVLLAATLVLRDVADGGWWYTLTGLVLFSPVGALAALREPGPYVVPTLDTMGGLLAGMVRAPTTLVSTVPPVDAVGVVMLVPYLVGFLATLPAAWLAVASTRPLAPVVPVALGLAATIPLGVLVPSLLVPRGIVLALLLVGWAAVRARRREPRAASAGGSLAPSVAAVVTVALVSGLVGLLVPDDDTSDRVLLSGEGNDPQVASSLVQPREVRRLTPVLRASGVPSGQRLRFTVLDEYDGEGWVPATESPGTDGYGTFKRIGAEVAPLHPGRTVVVLVRLRDGFSGDWLPMLGELTRIDLDWNPGRTDLASLRYNQATGTAYVVGGADTRDEYELESVVPEARVSRAEATREPTDDQRQPAGEGLDELLRPFDREQLLPLERVLLLARYLRTNGSVRRDYTSRQSVDDLRTLLDQRRLVASPYEYTALVALAASRLGVPARVVTGAAVGPDGLVYNVDVESWVELQFADGTWRTLEPSRYLGEQVVADGADPVVVVDPERFVRDELAEAAAGGDDEIRPPEGSTNADGSAAERPRPAWQLVLLGASVLAGVLVLLLLLVPLVRALRRVRRRRTRSWSGRYVAAWQEVLDAARDRGTPVPDGWSRVAQARHLGAGLDLARRADAAVFAPARTDDDPDDFWRACQRLRRELLAGTPTRRARAWALVNPASLVAGWVRGSSASAAQAPRLRAGDA